MSDASVPEGVKQASKASDPREWNWVEPVVWNERMLAALGNGVKGGKWFSLWDKVYAKATLEASWRRVKRNGGAAGVDNVSVTRFASHEEAYLDELHDALKAERYRPQPVKRVMIPKPGGKQRPLGIPVVKDRIVQGGGETRYRTDLRAGVSAEQLWLSTGTQRQGRVAGSGCCA